MSKQFKIFSGVVIALLLGMWLWYPYSPSGAQARNMQKAEGHIPAVQSLLDKDQRFRGVHLSPFTAEGGSLNVGGTVRRKADLEDLKRIVSSTSPPVPVVFWVTVEPEKR